MANVFRLTLKIKIDGDQKLQETSEKVKDFKKEVGSVSADSFKDIAKVTKDIGTNVSMIQERFSGVVKQVVAQTSGALTNSLDNIAQEGATVFEKVFSRATVALGAFLIASKTGFLTFTNLVLSNTDVLFSQIGFFAKASFGTIGSIINSGISLITFKTEALFNLFVGLTDLSASFTANIVQSALGLLGFGRSAGTIATAFGSIAKGLTSLAGGVATFFSVRIALREANVLFQRFVGNGLKSTTVLEKITGIIGTIHSGITSIGVTTGTLLKSVSLIGASAAAFTVGPLPGIAFALAGINSVITNITSFFTRRAFRALSFFGSARGQLSLILFDLRSIATKALPELDRKADSLKNLGDKAEQADVVIKKVGKDLEAVAAGTAIKRTRLPFAAQFQQFAGEIRTFVTALLKQINDVFGVIKVGLGVTDKDVEKIQSKSKKASEETAKGVRVQSAALDKVFASGVKQLNIFDRSERKLKQFFTGNPLAKALKAANIEAGNLDKKFGAIGSSIRFVAKSFKSVFIDSFRKGSGVEDPKEKAKVKNRERLNQLQELGNKSIERSKNLADGANKSFVTLARIIQSGFSPAIIKGFESALQDLGKTLNGSVRDAIKRTPDGFKKIPEEINKAIKSVGIFGENVNSLKRRITGTKTSFANVKETIGTIPPVIKVLGSSFDDLQQPIKNVRKSIRKIPEDVLVAAKAFNKISESTQDIAPNIKKTTKEFTGLQSAMSKALFVLLDIRKTNKDARAGGTVFGGSGDNLKLRRFIENIKGFREGSKSLESAQLSFQKFGQVVAGVTTTLNSDSKVARETLDKLFETLRDPRALKEGPKDFKAFQVAFDNFSKSVAESGKKFGTVGKDVGVAFTTQLVQGFKDPKNKQEVERSIQFLVEAIMEFFPRSPAKKGPMKDLPKVGIEANKQIAKGLSANKKIAGAGAKTVAEQIAGYFPRSPALFGPLVGLVKMGTQIAVQLSQGMKAGLSIVASAASSLGSAIFSNLARVGELDLFSERFGVSVEAISSLNLALADSGATTQDFQFALTGLNRILGKTLSGEEAKKFEKLGLDIDKARKANEPTIALFLQLSDVLKDLPPQSEKFRLALESVGLTANSKIVNVLQQGRDTLRGFQDQAVKTGTVVDKAFAKIGREFISLTSRFKVVSQNFLNGFVREIAPVVLQKGKEFLQLFENNRKAIEVFLRAVGKGFAAIINVVVNFAQIVITEPRKAFEILSSLFVAFAKFVRDVFFILFNEVIEAFGNFFSGVRNLVVNTIKGLLPLSLSAVGSVVSGIFSALVKAFEAGFDGLLATAKSFAFELAAGLVVGISDALKNIPGGTFFGEKFGLILSEEEVSGLGEDIEKLGEKGATLTSTFSKIFEDASKESKGFSDVVKDSFKDFFDSDSKQQLTKSLTEFTGVIKSKFDEVSSFKIDVNTDLTASLTEAADLFKEKFGDAVEFSFGADAKSKTESFFSSLTEGLTGAGEVLKETFNIDFESLTTEVDTFFQTISDKVAGQEEVNANRRELSVEDLARIKSEKDAEVSAERKAVGEKLAIAGMFTTESAKLAKGLTTLLGKESKEAFIINKAIAVSQSIVDTAVGVNKALGAASPPINFILAGIVAAAGALNTGLIIAEQPSFAEGGLLSGPSHSNGGIQLAGARGPIGEAEGGEFIFSKKSTSSFGAGFLGMMNDLGKGSSPSLSPSLPSASLRSPTARKFEHGGLTPEFVEEGSKKRREPEEMIQIVNISDPSQIDSFLASDEGVQRVLNIIQNNPETVAQSIGGR